MKRKRTFIAIIVVVVLLSCGGGYYWYSQIKVPYENASSKFNREAKRVNNKNAKLDIEIKKGTSILESGDEPLNNEDFTNLQVAISTAKETKIIVPELPKKTEDVKKETVKLAIEIDYSDVTSNLENAISGAEKSIQQLKQVTNPTEDFVILKLKQIKEIEEIAPVTEKNDPNGKLNKPGGYTATVYFSANDVDKTKLSGSNLIDKGTSAGGAIEVYRTADDANKRNMYLESFDGGVLSSGSHSIIGTIVIRTSDELTASQQNELEKSIILHLTSID